ncbi:MAG TPA: carboxypeptidase-like regulatory domain-containing protein [Candidatus Saccharimonadales bacterium]|nr:carboxypeptidase-like regulatory domain-containing protein [Candidatus Saccharimonadales bacterium]
MNDQPSDETKSGEAPAIGKISESPAIESTEVESGTESTYSPDDGPEPITLPDPEAEESQDKPTSPAEPQAGKAGKPPRFYHRFASWYGHRKKWTIPASIIILILILAAIPYSRYHAAGLVLKNDVTVKVSDSVSGKPVSGAQVSVDKISALTNAGGLATLHSVKVGKHTLLISKKYYRDQSLSLLVPIGHQKTTPNVSFIATGRRVNISVINKINNQPVADATIEVSGTSAKTDKDGQAQVVVSASASHETASLSASGYNPAKVSIEVSAGGNDQNSFKLTPAGQVYFLSKLSGTIDVVKTNLDGTNRQTVLAGTGKEDDNDTVLLASRDWQYLALLANRNGSPSLYIINTSDDKMLTMDQGDATFTPLGWYNHYFVYTVAKNGYNDWQSGAFSIKSYNADTGQSLTLVNSNAEGTSNADAKYEAIWDTQLMGNNVIYTRTWYQYPGTLGVTGKQNVLAAIHPDGTASRQLKTMDASASYVSNLKLTKPNELDFGVYAINSGDTSYYSLDGNGNVSANSNLNDQSLYTPGTTYLLSPSGNQTFWQDERDGKNSLFIGDQNATGAKQIADLSDYNAYGWYSDNYLLVSKNNSELYIIPKSGITDDSQAIKITDYHKPAQSFYGYGGGYGGL